MYGKTRETRTRSHNSTGEPAATDTPGRFGNLPDGRNVARTLRWLDQAEKPVAVWSRSGSRQRLAEQLGVADTKRRKDTFPAERSCGIPSPAAEDGHAQPGERDRSRDSRRRLLHSLQHQLKTANFSRFSSLLQAFTHYDRTGKGAIDQEDLQTVCRQFQLLVSGSVLDDLVDYCDTDRDGLISFVEFANFLAWKDMMPITSQEEHILTRERQSSTASADVEEAQPPPPPRQALVRPEDLEPMNPSGSLKSVRTLVKQQADPDQFRTTSSVIGRRLQPHASSPGSATPTDSCTYGLPSVPRIEKVGDGTNQGAAAAGLLQPSVYHLHGVGEEQLLHPRSRKELSQIFRNVGVDLSEEAFEEVWTLASAEQEAAEVCVESFCRALKEIKAE